MEITTNPEAKMQTWTITTLAEGRRRSNVTMTHTISAETEADAIYEARMAHIWKGRVAMNRSIFITSIAKES